MNVNLGAEIVAGPLSMPGRKVSTTNVAVSIVVLAPWSILDAFRPPLGHSGRYGHARLVTYRHTVASFLSSSRQQRPTLN